MDLVMDANIFFAALLHDGITRALMLDPYLTLFAPRMILKEVDAHKERLINKAKLNKERFEFILLLLQSKITLVSEYSYGRYLKEAATFCPDEDDIEYFALALMLGYPLWSNDKALKNQQAVHVFSTDELLKMLEDRPG